MKTRKTLAFVALVFFLGFSLTFPLTHLCADAIRLVPETVGDSASRAQIERIPEQTPHGANDFCPACLWSQTLQLVHLETGMPALPAAHHHQVSIFLDRITVDDFFRAAPKRAPPAAPSF